MSPFGKPTTYTVGDYRHGRMTWACSCFISALGNPACTAASWRAAHLCLTALNVSTMTLLMHNAPF